MSSPLEHIDRARCAVEYLTAYDPIGPWLLAELSPAGGGPRCAEFQPTQADEAATWIAERIGVKNLYHHVGRCKPGMRKKADENDVLVMTHVVCDIDPRERPASFDGDHAEWYALQLTEIGKAIGADRPADIPEPTSIVLTGGGYQPRWRLAEPIDVTELEKRRHVKAIARGLGEKFRAMGLKADAVQSVDHLIRIPHTLNLPTESKLKRGRVVSWAEDMGGAAGRAYRLDELPAPIFEHGGSKSIDDGEDGASPLTPVIPEDVDDLTQYGAGDRLKRIIVEGALADRPKAGDNSGSQWEIDAACGLARLNVPVELFVGVFLREDWRIGDRCRRKAQSTATRVQYLLKLHERAGEFVAEPWLREMNATHAVLLQEGGKARVLSWEQSEIDPTREVPLMQSAADFKLRYSNRKVTKRVAVADPNRPGMTREVIKETRMGDAWLEHPRRRQHLGLRLMPDQEPLEDINGYLNMWRGFAVEPKAGDWSLLRAHIRDVIAAGDEASFKYIMCWSAWAVQNLDKAAEVALVVIGPKGAGKGTHIRALRRVFGQHGLHITSNIHLTGRFNSHLRDCLFLYADEAVNADDRDAESRLKGLITEPEVAIEGKGANLVQARNRLKIVMTANPGWVVPVGMEHERRYAVFQCGSDRVGDRAYFDALNREIEGGGLGAMLHDLLAVDLGNWHPRYDIPQTRAGAEQKAMGLKGRFEGCMLDYLRAGVIPVQRHLGETVQVSTLAVQTEVRETYRLVVTLNEIAATFRALGFEPTAGWVRPSGWVLPALTTARAAWDRAMAPEQWDEKTQWESTSRPPEPGAPTDQHTHT